MEVDEPDTEDGYDEEADDRFLNGLMESMARSFGVASEPAFVCDLVFPAPVKGQVEP